MISRSLYDFLNALDKVIAIVIALNAEISLSFDYLFLQYY